MRIQKVVLPELQQNGVFPDHFRLLTGAELRKLEEDEAEHFLNKLERLWQAGKIRSRQAMSVVLFLALVPRDL